MYHLNFVRGPAIGCMALLASFDNDFSRKHCRDLKISRGRPQGAILLLASDPPNPIGEKCRALCHPYLGRDNSELIDCITLNQSDFYPGEWQIRMNRDPRLSPIERKTLTLNSWIARLYRHLNARKEIEAKGDLTVEPRT